MHNSGGGRRIERKISHIPKQRLVQVLYSPIASNQVEWV